MLVRDPTSSWVRKARTDLQKGVSRKRLKPSAWAKTASG